MYLVSLKYLSSCSCLFLDVPTLLCKTGFTGWVMVSHNSMQTAFKIADLALHAVTLLTFHARIQYIYCYRLVAIMSTCYQLVAVESACMGQTDAPGGGSAHAAAHRSSRWCCCEWGAVYIDPAAVSSPAGAIWRAPLPMRRSCRSQSPSWARETFSATMRRGSWPTRTCKYSFDPLEYLRPGGCGCVTIIPFAPL